MQNTVELPISRCYATQCPALHTFCITLVCATITASVWANSMSSISMLQRVNADPSQAYCLTVALLMSCLFACTELSLVLPCINTVLSNAQETYQYAKTLLSCATSNVDGRKRALLVGGGIANFTDVAATFKGIVRAITEYVEAIKAAKLHIYVRRGGPNYEAGLDMMQKLGHDTGLQIDVFGPTTSMTGICKLAIDDIES